MDLKCKKLDCEYNKCFACNSKEINVNKKCECSTYHPVEKKDKKDHQDISRDMFEAAPEINPFRHKKDVQVLCSAHCLFNVDGKCMANGISVSNQHTATCITAIPK